MSDSFTRTILLDYELIESGVRTRTTIQNDNVGILLQGSLSTQRLTLTLNQQLSLNNIGQVLYIRCSGLLQVSLNGDNPINVTDMLYITSSFSSVVIVNPNAAAVTCLIVQG